MSQLKQKKNNYKLKVEDKEKEKDKDSEIIDMFEENNKKNNNNSNNNINDQRANYIETFGNKNINDSEKTDNALSWLDNNDTKIKDNYPFIDTNNNENNDNNNDDNFYHDSQENININNNAQMEDKEVQVKITSPKKKLPPSNKK